MLTVNLSDYEKNKLNEMSAYYGLDYKELYKPSIMACPFIKKTFISGVNIARTVTKQETCFAYNYLQGGKAQLKYLAPDTSLTDTYAQVTFKIRNIKIVVESVTLQCTIARGESFTSGSLARDMADERASLFRYDTANLFLQMLDNAAFRGRDYNNTDINNEGYRCFLSESTDPVDVGLPTTVTGGSLTDLINLLSKASNYLATSGGKPTMQQNICIFMGRQVATQYVPVISGAESTDGLRYAEEVIKRTFGFQCFVTDALDNEMIIFDKREVEVYIGDRLEFARIDYLYTRNPVHIIASIGLCSVVVYNKEKSLYYSDVIQETQSLVIKQSNKIEVAKKAKAKKAIKVKSELMAQAKESLKGTKWEKEVDKNIDKATVQEVPSIMMNNADMNNGELKSEAMTTSDDKKDIS